MAVIKKAGKFLSIIFVVMVAVTAGLFLSACRRVQKSGEPTTRPKPPTTTQGDSAAAKPAATTQPTIRTIDVEETLKGQPIPRNLLE